MASVMAHELNETVTDPDDNAWFHIDGTGEVGDLCSFNFGTKFPAVKPRRVRQCSPQRKTISYPAKLAQFWWRGVRHGI